ncbi:DUF2125 domain-containing protein [Puniceibacterium sediminis]|uniref:DUF2125 domain-containing protein n=1 Tax=Puniceibacterium sediminis TaxID=1608407 RepID=A0A238VDX4_9RHOB|nr:DUF2125 domain-containing protein [Puniceibacterium sediminis]SNR32595.1 hypothetical protein SAMN06265370_10230 [Puniceibacterium sediminis]
MHRTTHLMSCSAIGAFMLAAPVSADITPQQVWDDLEAYMSGFGYAVSGAEQASGDALTISDFVLSMDLPEGEGNFSFAADKIVLTQMDDGSVSVVFPAEMPITLTARPEDAKPVDMVVNYTQNGLDMVVSGTPGDMVYDYNADTLGMVLSELVVDGAPLSRDMARFDVTMNDVEGKSTITLGDMREVSQVMSMGSVAYDFAFNNPDGAGNGLFSGRMADLSIDGSVKVPLEIDPEDPAAMLAQGFAFDGAFAHSGGSMQFGVTEAGKTTSGQTSTESSNFRMAMSSEAMTYDVSSLGVTLDMKTPDFPFPVSAKMAENRTNLTLPMAAADEPQDMAIGMTLGGFTMSDVLWNLFDPARTLPRDPATISVDLVGTVTPFVNMFDPEAVALLEQTGGVPGELNTLTLKELIVEAVGARLTGTGDFSFDNSDLVTFDGMPAPDGSVSFSLTGGNALIDRLIAMGVLKEQDAMGARMMMSMFSVPGDGEDSLKSDIVVKGNGQILANGQRIR